MKTYTQLALIPETSETSPLMSAAQAAAYLSVEVATLSVWRCTARYGLPYLKIGRLVRYRKADLDAFLEARRVGFVEETQ